MWRRALWHCARSCSCSLRRKERFRRYRHRHRNQEAPRGKRAAEGSGLTTSATQEAQRGLHCRASTQCRRTHAQAKHSANEAISDQPARTAPSCGKQARPSSRKAGFSTHLLPRPPHCQLAQQEAPASLRFLVSAPRSSHGSGSPPHRAPLVYKHQPPKDEAVHKVRAGRPDYTTSA